MTSVWPAIWQSLAWGVPYFVVLFVGIVFAIVRWKRHPSVSALLIAALGATVVNSLAYRISVPLVFSSRSGAPTSSVSLYLGLIAIISALVRAACWAAVIVAILGWRSAQDGRRVAPLQFSIRGLIVATFAVAILCGLGRWLVGLLGQSAPMLLQIVDDLPLIACLGIGIWIAAARWSRHPHVSHLATWAFVMAIAVSLVPQLIIIFAMNASIRSGTFVLLINLTALLASIVSWVLAIAAALGWRSPEPPHTILTDQTSPSR